MNKTQNKNSSCKVLTGQVVTLITRERDAYGIMVTVIRRVRR